MKANWKKLLKEACGRTGDKFEDLEIATTRDKHMFIAWGEKFIYFLSIGIGQTTINYLPRNPCGGFLNPAEENHE